MNLRLCSIRFCGRIPVINSTIDGYISGIVADGCLYKDTGSKGYIYTQHGHGRRLFVLNIRKNKGTIGHVAVVAVAAPAATAATAAIGTPWGSASSPLARREHTRLEEPPRDRTLPD